MKIWVLLVWQDDIHLLRGQRNVKFPDQNIQHKGTIPGASQKRCNTGNKSDWRKKSQSFGFHCDSNDKVRFIMGTQNTDFPSLTSSVTLLVFFSHTSYGEALWHSGHTSSRGNKVKHFKHFGTSQCHPTCQHCKACKPQGTSRGHMEFLVKIHNQREALVTVEEAGVTEALAQASSGTPSPSGSSIWGRSCIRAGELIIGLPWLDAISSVTAGISWGLLLSASHEPTGRTAASAHLGTHTTHSSPQQAVGDFFPYPELMIGSWAGINTRDTVCSVIAGYCHVL